MDMTPEIIKAWTINLEKQEVERESQLRAQM
jgi:hypothetical protein